jgi:hypothetical protein
VRSYLMRIVTLAVAMLALGCGQKTSQSGNSASPQRPSAPSAEGAKFILAQEPSQAKGVLAVREESKDGDEVAIVGRIGGSTRPMGKRATFTIVDPSLKHCGVSGDDGCLTPWDYCCEPGRTKATAMIKFVGADGEPLATDARTLLAVMELDLVVIRGKAQRDKDRNLVVLADGVYLREQYQGPPK